MRNLKRALSLTLASVMLLGMMVVGSSAAAISRTQATSVGSQNDGWIVELGERLYDGSLKLNDDTLDDFGRPSRTWEFDGKAIGTYAKKELIREEYTAKVSGKMLYELLTRNVINDYDLEVYVDGAEVVLDKNQLVRSNENSIRTTSTLYGATVTANYGQNITGNGVETEIFVDPDAGLNGEITIVIVNTWLAKATSDYNASTETATLEVYHRYGDGQSIIKRVDVEDVPNVADLKEDDFVLVNWASDTGDFTSKDVLIVSDVPEVLTDVTVTEFSKSSEDDRISQRDEDHVTDITTGGTKYSDSFKAFYEYATLGDYNGELLTKRTYDIYMDKYGYFIGATLHSGDDQYVFISAANNNLTSLGLRNSDALAIFVDGTMATINVNVTDTNKNINRIRNLSNDGGVTYVNPTVRNDAAYDPWDADTEGINRWFTYTEDNGVYTLTPVTRYVYDEATDANERIEIKSDRVSLRGSVSDVATGNAYGDDDSVYITADLIKSEKDNFPVDEITGRYTGVQSVRLTYENARPIPATDPNNGWISAVYDSKNNIIAAVLNGEAEGSTDNYAYILSGAKTEGYDGDYYRWTFDAILGGEIQTLTIKSRYSRTVNDLVQETVQELIFDTDGNVTTIRDIADRNSYSGTSDKVFNNIEYEANLAYTATHLLSDFDVYEISTTAISNTSRYTTAASEGVIMTLQGNTLHFEDDVNADDRGLAIAPGAKAVVRQVRNGSTKKDMFDSVRSAYNTLANARENQNLNDGKFYFYGKVTAVLDGDGRAAWVFFDDLTPVYTGNNRPYATTNNQVSSIFNYNQITYTIPANSTNANPSIGQILTDVIKAQGWAWDETRDNIKSDNTAANRYLASYRGVEYVITVVNNANQGGNTPGTGTGNVKVTVDTTKMGTNTVANAWTVDEVIAPADATEAQIINAIKAEVMRQQNVASYVGETAWNDGTNDCWTLEFLMRDGGHKFLIWNKGSAAPTVQETLNSPSGTTLDNAIASPSGGAKKEVTFTGNTNLTGKTISANVTVNVPEGSTVTLGDGSTVTGNITGAGTVKVAGGTLDLKNVNTTGTVELAGGSVSKSTGGALDTVKVTGDATITGASTVDKNTEVTLSNNAKLTLGSNATTLPVIKGSGTVEIASGVTVTGSENGKLENLGEKLGSTAKATEAKTATINVAAPAVRLVGEGALAGFSSSSIQSYMTAQSGATSMGFINVVLDCVKQGDIVKGWRTTAADPNAAEGVTWTAVAGVLSGDGAGYTVTGNDGLQTVMLEGDNVTGLKYTVKPVTGTTGGDTPQTIYGTEYTIIFVIK